MLVTQRGSEEASHPHHRCGDQRGRRQEHDAEQQRGKHRDPAHRAKATREFVASTDGRLTLIFLPGYAPQLNPDEWVWKNVKHDQLGRRDFTDRAELKTRAIGALRRLQKLPHLVRSFFADPQLRYITE